MVARAWTYGDAVDEAGADSQAEGRGFDPRLPLSEGPRSLGAFSFPSCPPRAGSTRCPHPVPWGRGSSPPARKVERPTSTRHGCSVCIASLFNEKEGKHVRRGVLN